MVPEMQLVITEDRKTIKTLTKETNTKGAHLVKSLQEFQEAVNLAITHIIEERGGNNQDDNEDLNEEGEDEEDGPVPVSPKKRKK